MMDSLEKHRRSQWKLFSGIIGSTVSVFLVCIGFVLAENGVQVFLLGIAFSTMLLLLSPVYFNRNYFLFEPHTYVMASAAIGMFLKVFYLFFIADSSGVVTDRLLLGLGHRVLEFGSFVIFVGFFCYVIGYFLIGMKGSRVRIFSRYGYSVPKAATFGWLLFLSSLIFFFLHIAEVGFSYTDFSDLSQKRFLGESGLPGDRFGKLSYIYYKLSLLSKAALYVSFYTIVKYRHRWVSTHGLLFVFCFILNMAVPFFVSNKAGLVLPIFDLMVIAYIITGELKLQRTVLVILATVAVLGLAVSLRGGDSISNFSVLDRIFLNRYFVDVTKTAHIVNAVPLSIDYFEGRSFVGWLNLVLPSSMDFDSIYFGNMGFYLGETVFFQPSSGVTPGIIAESYLNFGLVGVLLMLFAVGMGMRYIHNVLLVGADNAIVTILYAIFVVRAPTMLFNTSLSVALLKTISDMLVVVIFCYVIKSRRKNSVY